MRHETFLPLIPFWFMKARANDNQSNIKILANNKDGTNFSFIVFGDSHNGRFTNDASALKLAWHMNRTAPADFALNVGDVTFAGEKSHYKAYKKIQNLIKCPVITAIGNHDNRHLFEKYCGSKQFVFSNRNSFFIIIDNTDDQIHFAWLEEKLKEGQRYKHIFIVMHKPLCDPQRCSDFAPWARELRNLLAKHSVDMVFSGHKHMFKHLQFEGVDYITTGGGGMVMEIPESRGYLHYVHVTVLGERVTYEVRKIPLPLWLRILYYLAREMPRKLKNYCTRERKPAPKQ